MGKKPPPLKSLLNGKSPEEIEQEKEQRQKEMEEHFDDKDKVNDKEGKGALREVTSDKNGNGAARKESGKKNSGNVSQFSNKPKASSANTDSDDFSIHSVLVAPAVKEGYVKRNFNIRNDHMNGIKLLTQRANNNGSRKTQDDIINAIFKDFFERHPQD